jgi:hypothetical protein
MKLSIILATILSNFAITATNLCDDVYLDADGDPVTDWVGQTLSRYCEWTGPDAPVWNANVCCTIDADGAACSQTIRGRCPTGSKLMYCEHGAAMPLGGVTCYQPFPSACDAGFCVEASDTPPLTGVLVEFIMCCSPGGACQYVQSGEGWDCQGELLACEYGSTDANTGSVECFD